MASRDDASIAMATRFQASFTQRQTGSGASNQARFTRRDCERPLEAGHATKVTCAFDQVKDRWTKNRSGNREKGYERPFQRNRKSRISLCAAEAVCFKQAQNSFELSFSLQTEYFALRRLFKLCGQCFKACHERERDARSCHGASNTTEDAVALPE